MFYSCHNTITKQLLAFVTFLSISALCSGFSPPSFRHTTVKLSMASSFLMESPRQSFEDRMRNAVLGGRRKEPSAASKPVNLPDNIKVATTLDEYKNIVGGERERLVVVRFYAPWCKACKAIRPLFYRLAHEFTNVLFVDVPVTEANANLHQGLGIPSLPFGHIYSPQGGLVEELKITRPHFPQFAHKLQSYVSGSCELIDGEVSSPYKTQNKELPVS